MRGTLTCENLLSPQGIRSLKSFFLCFFNINGIPHTHYTFSWHLQQIIQDVRNLHIPTHNPTHTIKLYKFNISDKWINSPYTYYPIPTPPLTQNHQIPTEIHFTQPMEYNPITKHFYIRIIHLTIRQRKHKPRMIVNI